MSRTIRRLSIEGSHGKWYTGGFYASDIRVLRQPCPPEQHRYFIEYREKHGERLKYTRLDIPPPLSYDDYLQWYKRHQHTLARHEGYSVRDRWDREQERFVPDHVEVYDSVPHTYKEKVWVANPNYDEKLDDQHRLYMRVHKEVFRNGTCVRQRKNGTRKTKQLIRRKARCESQRLMARDLEEHFRCPESDDMR